MHDAGEVPEYVSVPDTIALSDRLKSTLQEGDNDIGQDDIQSMFYDSNLYKLDNLLFAEISDVYQKVIFYWQYFDLNRVIRFSSYSERTDDDSNKVKILPINNNTP